VRAPSSIRRLCLIPVCFLGFVPTRASAQAAAAPPAPPKHEATGEIAFVGTSGNASTSAFSVSGEDIARPTNWTVRNKVTFIRNEAESVLTAQSFFYGFRAERVINKKLSAFGEYGYFRDTFAGIDSRNSVNGGLSIKLIDTDRQQLSADGLLGYLNEQRVTGDDISSATYGFGGDYKLKISPTATLDEDARFVGTFDRAEDWRFVQAFSVTAQMTTILSLKFSNVVRYSNFPAATFKKTDTTTSVALVAKFKKG
jgi:putative salt-induced outer membrane protein YdiY